MFGWLLSLVLEKSIIGTLIAGLIPCCCPTPLIEGQSEWSKRTSEEMVCVSAAEKSGECSIACMCC